MTEAMRDLAGISSLTKHMSFPFLISVTLPTMRFRAPTFMFPPPKNQAWYRQNSRSKPGRSRVSRDPSTASDKPIAAQPQEPAMRPAQRAFPPDSPNAIALGGARAATSYELPDILNGRAAGFADGFGFHEFGAGAVRIVEVELPLAVAANRGLSIFVSATRHRLVPRLDARDSECQVVHHSQSTRRR